MTTDDCYKIGFIMRPHGLKGEVTVSLDTEAPEDLNEIQTIFVHLSDRLLPYFIERISLRGAKAFVKLEDVDTAEAAENISRSAIYLPKSTRPRSRRGAFYDDEVIGFEVSDTALGTLGKVTAVMQAGPNKLLSVDHEGKEVLIPVNGPFIDSVNKSRKTITVTLPEGFLDL